MTGGGRTVVRKAALDNKQNKLHTYRRGYDMWAKLKKHLTIADLLLGLGFLLLAAAIALWAGGSLRLEPGAVAEIRLSGQLVGEYALDTPQVLTLENRGFHNRVVIAEGQVKVESADCPDQYCVRHQAVSRAGEHIICLPALLVITVREEESRGLDAVAK